MALYDEDGNLVEDTLSGEEAKALKDLADKTTKLEEELKEKDAILAKLQNKDNNLRNIERKTNSEKEDIRAKMSAEQTVLLDRIDSLQKQIDDRENATVGKVKNDYVRKLAGKDENVAKLIEAEVERFEKVDGRAVTEEQMAERIDDAYAIVERRMKRSGNPINSYSPNAYVPDLYGERAPKNFADTPEGQSLANSLGLLTEVPKK